MRISKAALFTFLLIILLYVNNKIILAYNFNPTIQVLLVTLILMLVLLAGHRFNFGKFKESIIPNLEVTQAFYIGIIGVIGIFVLSISIPNLIRVLVLGENLKIVDSPIFMHNLILSLLILPLLEELFFRNLLTKKLNERYNAKKAIFVSAFLFAISHIHINNGIFPQFLGGLFFGYIYLYNKNNWFLTFKLHLIYNLFTITITTNVVIMSFIVSLSYIHCIFLILIGFALITLSVSFTGKGNRENFQN
ncbi:MAG: CPBP family intramembrane glutamic endopeptidase [Saonia sp.]